MPENRAFLTTFDPNLCIFNPGGVSHTEDKVVVIFCAAILPFRPSPLRGPSSRMKSAVLSRALFMPHKLIPFPLFSSAMKGLTLCAESSSTKKVV